MVVQTVGRSEAYCEVLLVVVAMAFVRLVCAGLLGLPAAVIVHTGLPSNSPDFE